MTAIGAALIALLLALVGFGGRRLATLSMLAGVLYLTPAQLIDVGGLHLYPMRLLELAAVLRLLARGELARIRWNKVDRGVFLLYAYTTTVFFLRSQVERSYVLGVGVDAVLCHLAFRGLLREADDLRALLRSLVWLLLPYVGLLMVEMSTGENPFGAIGGLSFVARGDRPRCMGTFRHPSLLGTVGAAFLPLYLALAHQGGGRMAARVGAACCVAIVLLANSGAPLSAAVIGLMGWWAWPLREHMASVRRSLLGVFVILVCLMKAPVWYLTAKVSSFSGGDGWHRSHLMEVAYRELGAWWLAGIDLSETRDWFDYTLAVTGSADITNQYLFFGLTAGLGSLLIFLGLIRRAFSALGTTLAAARAGGGIAGATDPAAERLLWGLGCAVTVHIATWFGITYVFDQTYVLWSLQLAAIASLSTAGVDLPAAVSASPATPAASPSAAAVSA